MPIAMSTTAICVSGWRWRGADGAKQRRSSTLRKRIVLLNCLRRGGDLMNTTYLLIGLLVLVGLYLLWLYNSLVRVKTRVQEAWSQIDVQLKRRIDLIPNLLETVKGYAKHEKGVFENVTKARSAMMGAKTVKESEEADNMLTGALKTLFAVAENYPELKASDNFKDLQGELADT